MGWKDDMTMEKPIQTEYEKPGAAQREEALRAIAGGYPRFHSSRFERFEYFGKRAGTALYDSEFFSEKRRWRLYHLSLASRYRDPDIFDDNLDCKNDIGGDYLPLHRAFVKKRLSLEQIN